MHAPIPAHLAPGAPCEVRIDHFIEGVFWAPGHVLGVAGDRVAVEVGAEKYSVPLDDVRARERRAA